MKAGEEARDESSPSPSPDEARLGDGEAKSGLPEFTKKVLSLGLGAFFLGEDYVRRAVKEAKLPREIGKSLAQNASKGKEELFAFMARELTSFLRQMDVQAELSRFAETHRIRVTTEIEFVAKTGEEKAQAEDSAASSSRGEDVSPETESRDEPVEEPGEGSDHRGE